MDTMRALVRHGREARAFEVRSVPVPEIAPDEVLVKVAYAGICGTDPHTYRTEDAGLTEPLIQGHEYSGTIRAIGGEVTGWSVGDRVAPESCVYYCGTCRLCQTNHHYLCRDHRSYSYGIQGVFAEYAKAPARILHRVPEGVSLRQASMAEPFCVSYQAVVVNNALEPGETVVVVGPGPIGLLAAMSARIAGASQVIIVGTEGDELRLQLAMDCGATMALNSSEEDPVPRLRALGGGYGADLVVDAAGPQSVLQLALDIVRPGGRIAKIAPTRARICMDLDSLVHRNVALNGFFGLTWETWEKCMTFMASGQADLERVATHELPLDQWRTGYELVEAKQAAKVLLTPGTLANGG